MRCSGAALLDELGACGRPGKYRARGHGHLCQEHALQGVRTGGLTVLQPEERARFLAGSPGYASGARATGAESRPRGGPSEGEMDPRLSLSLDEQATIRELADVYPELLSTLETYVAPLTERLILTFQGRIRSESQADELLVRLVDTLAARTAAPPEGGGDAGERAEAIVRLVARHLVARTRDQVVQRLLAPGPTA